MHRSCLLVFSSIILVFAAKMCCECEALLGSTRTCRLGHSRFRSGFVGSARAARVASLVFRKITSSMRTKIPTSNSKTNLTDSDNTDTAASASTSTTTPASVHLQLTRTFNIPKSDEPKSNKTTISLMEFVDLKGNTILASLGDNRTKLELFSQFSFGRNLSEDQTVLFQLVNISRRSSTSIQLLQQLWHSKKLLALTKDPIDALRSGMSFEDVLMGFVKKMQTIDDDQERTSRVLAKFFEDKIGGALVFRHDTSRPANTTLDLLKKLSVLFKENFPYYYDNCQTCGHARTNDFVGYVVPSQDETAFKPGRTELYKCSACGSFTRFPRYNVIQKILETKRGRCGEYSILMLKMLEYLGYTTRWVVDWTDHVWVEVLVGERWVHVDPCEAAVDEPLLYQSWGKNQTYVLAFTREEVHDVTAVYTTNFTASLSRREIAQGEFSRYLSSAAEELRSVYHNLREITACKYSRPLRTADLTEGSVATRSPLAKHQ